MATHPLQEPISLEVIRAAQERIAGSIVRTPLIRLNVDDAPAEIYLKLENLQPVGAFKIRGAGNALLRQEPSRLAQGIWTASAGSFALGLAWQARQMGVSCAVIVPDNAPETKLAGITRLGARITRVPYTDWFDVLRTHTFPGMDGVFIHPASDPDVIAGNGTIGLEILEDLPDVDAVVIPYGGGGLSAGVASAVRALRPRTRLYACEVETMAPLAAALAAGEPREIPYAPTFVDAIGGLSVLADTYPLVSRLLDGSLVTSVAEVASAVRLLAERNRVIAEGAGATSVAVALAGKAGSGQVACIISGGNLDSEKLVKILHGEIP